MKRDKIISCIGIHYIEPILRLYEELISFNYTGDSRIKVSPRENGFSVSIIVLSVLTIESALNRIRYIKKDSTQQNNLNFFKNKFNHLGLKLNLYNKLAEIYVLRDIIAHNHIWKISYTLNDRYDETKVYQKLLKGYGDKKYNDHVNKKSKETKILKLNINPIKIGIKDVNIVLCVLEELFEFFNSIDLFYFPIKNFDFKFKNQFMKFSDIIDKIMATTN